MDLQLQVLHADEFYGGIQQNFHNDQDLLPVLLWANQQLNLTHVFQLYLLPEYSQK